MKRVMLTFGIIACCGMFVSGFRMIHEGAEVNRENEESRELMQSILKIEDAGVEMPQVSPQASPPAKSSPAGEEYPAMNWYKAVEYCKGQGKRLPTVSELTEMYKSECTGGRQSSSCGKWLWFWSSEESGADYARVVDFDYGYVYEHNKYHYNSYVRCR